MFGFLKKLFGTAQGRLLKKYGRVVAEVNRFEEKFQSLSEEELRNKTNEFGALDKGEPLDQLLPEAYAVVKNACRRLCGTDVHVSGYDQKWDMVPYDVQILGGIAMHYGAISEMQTGEGKTLTAVDAALLNALTKKPVHLVTVNDYLVQRDCEWVGAIFRMLGLTVNALTGSTPHHLRKSVYEADILYGTASEFGFDYLRDNSMAQSKEDQCQRGHYFAIVDEIDSTLIDEARTPLIISGPSGARGKCTMNSKTMWATRPPPTRPLQQTRHRRPQRFRKVGKPRRNSRAKNTEAKNKKRKKKKPLRKLWLVGKGTPHNKILKRVKRKSRFKGPNRKWDIYFYGDPNKEERAKVLCRIVHHCRRARQ